MENFDLLKIAVQEYEQDNENGEDVTKNEGNCDHSDTIEENGCKICLDCGEEISRDLNYDKEWRYYGSEDTRRLNDPNRCHIRKCEDRTIFKDVENLGFSDRIVAIANDIYSQVTYCQTTKNYKIYRGNSRKAIVFACVFQAFKMIDKPQSYDSLREIFNLDRKIVSKGLKHVNLNVPKNSSVKTKYITPVELVEEIMDKFNASSEQKAEVVKLYDLIRNKSSMLNRSRPQSVASGLIYYYISNVSKDINLKDFTKKVKLSELTVNKISKEIERIIDTK